MKILNATVEFTAEEYKEYASENACRAALCSQCSLLLTCKGSVQFDPKEGVEVVVLPKLLVMEHAMDVSNLKFKGYPAPIVTALKDGDNFKVFYYPFSEIGNLYWVTVTEEGKSALPSPNDYWDIVFKTEGDV